MFILVLSFGVTMSTPESSVRSQRALVISAASTCITLGLTILALIISISWAGVFASLCLASFLWFLWFGSSGEFGGDDYWGGDDGDDGPHPGDDPGPGGLGRDLDWSEFDSQRERWDSRVSA